MATELKNVLSFQLVPVGATVSLPHGLNIDGVPRTPDILTPSYGGFNISADATNVTVTNTNSQVATVEVLAEIWHTIERAFGDVDNLNLVPRPFVVASNRTTGHVDWITRAGWTSWVKGETYQFASGEVLIPSPADVPPSQPNCQNTYPFMWLFNTSPDKSLVAHTFLSFHDGGMESGGPAAHPGTAFMKMKNLGAFGNLPPTANMSAAAIRRTNPAVPGAPAISAFAWNGAGNGLIMPAGAVLPGIAPTVFLQPGKVSMDTDQISILPPGFPFAILLGIAPIGLVAGESMQAQISYIGYHVDPSDLFP